MPEMPESQICRRTSGSHYAIRVAQVCGRSSHGAVFAKIWEPTKISMLKATAMSFPGLPGFLLWTVLYVNVRRPKLKLASES